MLLGWIEAGRVRSSGCGWVGFGEDESDQVMLDRIR